MLFAELNSSTYFAEENRIRRNFAIFKAMQNNILNQPNTLLLIAF